jgi:small subunit ribosomal protein S6
MKKELEFYELVLLMNFTSTEQETVQRIDYYRDLLTGKGSQVMVKNHGKRPLAYPIQRFDTATYIQMIYLGNGDLVTAISKEIKRDSSVLRAITTKIVDQPTLEVVS